jgi:hypothetical protein
VDPKIFFFSQINPWTLTNYFISKNMKEEIFGEIFEEIKVARFLLDELYIAVYFATFDISEKFLNK